MHRRSFHLHSPHRSCAQDSDSDEEAAEAAVSAEAEAGAGVVASAAAAAASKTGAEAAKPAKRKLPSALDALKSGGSKPSFLQAADTAGESGGHALAFHGDHATDSKSLCQSVQSLSCRSAS